MSATPCGTLIIVGGSEDKSGQRSILKTIARAAGTAGREQRIVVVTTATESPQDAAARYRTIFAELGVARVDHLDLRTRDEAYEPAALDVLAGAPVVFFTGGNQLRISTHLGGTPIMQRLHELYTDGGTIAGTSAGAVALGEHMPFEPMPHERLDVALAHQSPGKSSGKSSVATSSFCTLPGLALLPSAIIDSHFSQRNRMWRLHAALSTHGGALALGVDEDTALCVSGGSSLSVIGQGRVYMVENARLDQLASAEEDDGIAQRTECAVRELRGGDAFQLDRQRAVTSARVPARGQVIEQ